ncbi:Imm8 family immunity protein [Thiolinea disciformis]|uniref:Imm8 family immunity protein n=1 Tax=Thiolinea disciformis TaxID=125614 RepID=UPI00037E6CD3|nr:Imm8 family immunity protein [Thiolinea disciformis]
MHLEVKKIFSTELRELALPEDPACCAVTVFVDIGLKHSEGAEQFHVLVVTPQFLIQHPATFWGKGCLLIPEFSWREVIRMIERLVSSISVCSWDEAVKVLCNYMEWEFENYLSSDDTTRS